MSFSQNPELIKSNLNSHSGAVHQVNENLVAFHLSELVLKHLGLPSDTSFYRNFKKRSWKFLFNVSIPSYCASLSLSGAVVSFFFIAFNLMYDNGYLSVFVLSVISSLLLSLIFAVLLTLVFEKNLKEQRLKRVRVNMSNFHYYSFFKDLKIDITKDVASQKDKISYFLIWCSALVASGKQNASLDKLTSLEDTLLNSKNSLLRIERGNCSGCDLIELENDLYSNLIYLCYSLSNYLKVEMVAGGRYEGVVKELLESYSKKLSVPLDDVVDKPQSKVKSDKELIMESNAYLMSLLGDSK